jgi:DNA-binding MurR/RpiR family transcriptional regulator
MSTTHHGKQVLASVRSLITSLPPSEQKIANVVLDDPEAVIHMTVLELAQRAGTAESTAVRCCHKLGYTGFQDLKIRLARELATGIHDDHEVLTSSSTPSQVLRSVLAFDTQVISDISSSLDPGAFDAAVGRLLNARRVALLAFGFSYFVCLDAQDRLSSIGMDARAPESPNMKLMLTNGLEADDVAFCVSHTGATKEVLRYAELAQRRGATTVALTSYARSKLAKIADITLVAGGREIDFRFDAASARLAQLAVLDAIYLALALNLGEKAETSLAIYHDEESGWRL